MSLVTLFAQRSIHLIVALVASGALSAAPPSPDEAHANVARGDLDYTTPATRSEEGMPVGNGRMGSLVWTTPSALKFQPKFRR